MSEIVCQVGNRADQMEFIWSSRGGYFRPYIVSGTQLIELCQAVGQNRAALESVVYARSRGDEDSGELPHRNIVAWHGATSQNFFIILAELRVTLHRSLPGVAVQVLRRVGASLDQMLIFDEFATN